MSTQPQLSTHFADAFPELAVPWRAEDTPDPRLVVLNEPLAEELGLDPDWLRTDEGVAFLLGHSLPDDARPVAQGYAGHQFGQFVPRLGDGRALLLGEVTDRAGRLRDIHLKGAGPTPFSRGGDGRAALGPMLREYLVSEALHALGVPTTRSLAVLTTGRKIPRTHVQPGALLVRVAASHLRVGSFQYARLLDSTSAPDAPEGGELNLTRRLADAAIDRHHPQARAAENPYLALFESVMDVQLGLVAQWMRLGFIHGVMNTDNTTISGETIDYGPCAFMDAFNPDTVYSSIDAQGRYSYQNQPAIIGWNLARFVETILPLIDGDVDRAIEQVQPVMDSFSDRYRVAWLREISRSLGLPDTDVPGEQEKLLDDLVELLTAHQPDLTRFNRLLAETETVDGAPVLRMFTAPGDAAAWLGRWLAMNPDRAAMKRTNPIYIPRNHLLDEALQAAEDGDTTLFLRLLDAVSSPFEPRERFADYEHPAPEDFGRFITYCGT